MKKEIIIAKNKDHLQQLIKECIITGGNSCDLNHIDTSLVTDMSGLFYGTQFNGDISQWNVSNVRDMSRMFAKSSFNSDISLWNVSNVISMNCMFTHSQFNGDISAWNVSQVNNMGGMFAYKKFNGDISRWNVTNVTEMRNIFRESKIKNIPYWSKIEDFEDRRAAVESYRHKKILNKLISPNNTAHIIHKI